MVLASVNKAASDLSSHQKKIFNVDDHIGVVIVGLTAGRRVLSRYLRNECINHSFLYEAPLPVGRLVFHLTDKSQAAKTYLEQRFESFVKYSRDELIKDALLVFAIKETLQGEKLTGSICTVAIVGVGEAFHVIDQSTIQRLIDSQEIGVEAPDADEQGAPLDGEIAPMDI